MMFAQIPKPVNYSTGCLDLEYNIETFTLDWSDVTVEEVRAIQILHEERTKHQNEANVEKEMVYGSKQQRR
jgi:hypothetical protein